MGNTDGEVTTTLLRAAEYFKDNRILPSGFLLDGVAPDIAPYGEVKIDEDFVEGSDRVQYVVDVSGHQGPFSITVELLYQSIGFRWAENLRHHSTAESIAFFGYYDMTENIPVVVAFSVTEVDE